MSIYLIITSTPFADKDTQLQAYVSKVVPLFIEGGGVSIGRYHTTEQHLGSDGPAYTAIFEFPSSTAQRDVLEGDAFLGLSSLRNEVFEHLDLMECAHL